MATDINLHRSGNRITLSITLELSEGMPMMECETEILAALNEAGCRVTGECLGRYDTDGAPIEVGGVKFTSKGQVSKSYQTPYGEVTLPRHVYQSSEGGATYCPLDHSARIIDNTTPRFARMCARKYATLNSSLAQEDLAECHQREVSRCYLQYIAEAVAAIVQEKQPAWKYADPVVESQVALVGLGIDGTCVLYCEEGYRTAMVGTISLYDSSGDRLHTTYIGAPPEYGKERFLQQMEHEIQLYKQRYRGVPWVGIADGATDYWPWLQQFVDEQILDFFHAASYLEKVANAFRRTAKQREEWFEQARHQLKHDHGAARRLWRQMSEALQDPAMKGGIRHELEKAVSYFGNNLPKMDYARYRERRRPIGSGVTEAACKTLVKQRMCGSGMKWKHSGAATVLSLRSLVLSHGRWQQFWSKLSRFGA